MTKIVLLTGIALLFCQTANAANCVPTGTNPGNPDLLKAIKCLQDELDKNVLKNGQVVDLRFDAVNWCVARGDPGDNKVYTIPCGPGAPGSGQSRIFIEKHQ